MKIKLDISSNNLKVYFTSLEDLHAVQQTPVSAEGIRNVLEEKQIVYGIKDDVIEKIDGKKEPVVDVVIVEGKAPAVGKRAEVIVQKRPKRREEVLPKANEKGDVDYISPREGWIVVVNKGDDIAVKTSPTQGEPGTNIYGKEIPGIWGKDFDLDEMGGINTQVDRNVLVATIDGFVIPRATKLNVEPVFRIYDDIGPSTGSIEIPDTYKVEVAISKDIKAGYWVKAHKITVGGCVEDCEITANDLNIAQGIVGTSDLPVTASKINVGYINGSRNVYAKGIRVTREISNGASVYATQVKAYAIQGSSVVAGEGIWTDFVNGQNKIMVGIDYEAKTVHDRCLKELNDLEEPLEQLKKVWRNNEKRMAYLKELSKKNPKHPLIAKELPQIKEIKEKFNLYQKKAQALQAEKEKAFKKMLPTENPFFLIRNGFSRDNSSGSIIEPNSIIHVGHEHLKIMEPSNGGLMTITKGKFTFSNKYNIKEYKRRLNLIDW